MIGGCVTGGKYNMTATWYPKVSVPNDKTGQVKASYPTGTVISVMARGLTNLRGKDSGTMQDWGNILRDYQYLRVKTMTLFKEGDILAKIADSNGEIYGEQDIQFVVLGVTPTYDPFGSFMEYDVLCNKAEVAVNLVDSIVQSSDSTGVTLTGG